MKIKIGFLIVVESYVLVNLNFYVCQFRCIGGVIKEAFFVGSDLNSCSPPIPAHSCCAYT